MTERKVSKCTRWGRSVHHTHATTPHANLACIANKTYCTTKLTRCDEGSMTREANTWRGFIPREKGRSASAQDAAGMYTTPMSQPLMQPSHALPTNLLRNRTHWLRRRNHNAGGKYVAGRHNPSEK